MSSSSRTYLRRKVVIYLSAYLIDIAQDSIERLLCIRQILALHLVKIISQGPAHPAENLVSSSKIALIGSIGKLSPKRSPTVLIEGTIIADKDFLVAIASPPKLSTKGNVR